MAAAKTADQEIAVSVVSLARSICQEVLRKLMTLAWLMIVIETVPPKNITTPALA